MNQTNLVNVVAPGSLVNVERNAFAGTTYYENIPEGNWFVGKVYCGYKGTMGLDETEVILPDGTTGIADGALNGNGLISLLYMPDSVVCIGRNAFRSTDRLKTFKLSQGIKYILLILFVLPKILVNIFRMN